MMFFEVITIQKVIFVDSLLKKIKKLLYRAGGF